MHNNSNHRTRDLNTALREFTEWINNTASSLDPENNQGLRSNLMAAARISDRLKKNNFPGKGSKRLKNARLNRGMLEALRDDLYHAKHMDEIDDEAFELGFSRINTLEQAMKRTQYQQPGIQPLAAVAELYKKT